MRKGCKYGILFSVFPARAGVIPVSLLTLGSVKGIPRASGGDPAREGRYALFFEYSPRERG